MTRWHVLLLAAVAFDFIAGIWYSVHRARKAYRAGFLAGRITSRAGGDPDSMSDRAYMKEHNL